MDDYFYEPSFMRHVSGLDFEKFALNIIRLEAKTRNKELYKGDSAAPVLKDFLRLKYIYGFRFDAAAPNGIYNQTFTIVDVKKTSDLKSEAIKQIEQSIIRFERFSSDIRRHFGVERPLRYLLIVSSGSWVKEEFHGRSFSVDGRKQEIEIWSIENLVEKAKDYPFEYNAFLELIIHRVSNKKTIRALKSETEPVSKGDFEKQNDHLVDEIKNCFGKNRISLILGTGVSMDYNDKLSWDALSERLYNNLDEGRRFDNLSASLLILGGDNVSAVQYSKINLGGRYPTVLYNLIYPNKSAYRLGHSSLDECANLIERKTQNGARGIEKVITYNYDDYLEQSLKVRGVLYRTLYRPIDCLGGEIPIYHVHGYMPEGCDSSERRQFIKTIVLSEEDYFNSYGDSSNWSVAIQLETFKDDVCLFVGNSISDFNEKRLLNKTRQEKWKSHFAILYTKGLGFSDLAKIYMHFFYELNVKIIWAETIKDIPLILARI